MCDWEARYIGFINASVTKPESTRMMVGVPNSPPTHMLVAEVVGGEDHGVTGCTGAVCWATQSLSCVQLVLCKRGWAVDGCIPHVDVSHPHDTHHTTLISLHVTIYRVTVLNSRPIANPVVASWGWGVTVKNGFARVSWVVGSGPWTLCCVIPQLLWLGHYCRSVGWGYKILLVRAAAWFPACVPDLILVALVDQVDLRTFPISAISAR